MAMQKPKSPVLCLIGPTAIGKTRLAIALTKQLPCDIISVDSAMVYRGMNIGTAKPTEDILTEFPHQLLDLCDVTHAYSVAEFCQDVTREITASLARGRIPLLVGGTCLYFHALQQGLSTLPTTDETIRAQLLQEMEQYGLPILHARLTKWDPEAAARIHPNDPQRLLRALEVYLRTGKSLSEHFAEGRQPVLPFTYANIGIVPADREQLHQAIARRFEIMLAENFIAEVAGFYEREDVNENLPAMRAIGYRQAWQYLAGQFDFQEMQNRATAATRQLAKRQLTWLRHWKMPIQIIESQGDVQSDCELALKSLSSLF